MNFDVLRQKILEKAIRGELVPQLESEPEVEQIGEAPENVPFEIPEKWKWVPVNKIIELISGRDLDKSLIEEKASSSSVPYITGASQISSNEVLVNRWTSNGSVFSDNGDLLLTCKGTIGKLAINQIGICHIARQIMAIRPKDQISVDFAKIFFSAIENKLTSNAKSMIPGISRNNVLSLLCPLPPIEEQRRIVQRHNEIILEIDKAESAYNELAGPLSDRLRQLLLERAIQGKLVPQLESEPEVEQVGDAPEDVPFEIPEKWRWMQLNKVGKIVGGGTPKTSLSEYWDGGTIPWFTPADLGKVHGLYASDSARKITALGLKESSAVMMPPNSVLFSSRAPIGHIALAADSCCTNQGCKSFVPNVGIVLPLWGYFAMKARTPDMIARASGTTFKEISGKGVGETLVPIPPLEEQRRIVTKLSEILNVVRQLENSVLIS